MRTRLRLIVAGTALLTCGICIAQSPAAQEQFRPYLQVKPVDGEEETIRVFFSPSCQHSRMYMGFFRNLAATLPPTKRFELTPLVNKGDGISYAMAFAAVRRFYPAYLDNFVEASFIAAQDKGVSLTSWAGINRIGSAARIPVALPKLVMDNTAVIKGDVESWARARADLRVLNTPAVAVAGTYIVTPEFTNGDAQLFSQLINSVVSMAR